MQFQGNKKDNLNSLSFQNDDEQVEYDVGDFEIDYEDEEFDEINNAKKGYDSSQNVYSNPMDFQAPIFGCLSSNLNDPITSSDIRDVFADAYLNPSSSRLNLLEEESDDINMFNNSTLSEQNSLSSGSGPINNHRVTGDSGLLANLFLNRDRSAKSVGSETSDITLSSNPLSVSNMNNSGKNGIKMEEIERINLHSLSDLEKEVVKIQGQEDLYKQLLKEREEKKRILTARARQLVNQNTTSQPKPDNKKISKGLGIGRNLLKNNPLYSKENEVSSTSFNINSVMNSSGTNVNGLEEIDNMQKSINRGGKVNDKKRRLGSSGGTTMKELTEEQRVERRERNREHAKQSRMRKRFMLESLQNQMINLRKINLQLRQLVQLNIPDKAEKIFEECNVKDGAADFREYEGIQLGHVKTLVLDDTTLMSALTHSQQNFTISDPSLNDNPIVYASAGFLNLTGYKKEEIIGRNCRFLQGPGTDPSAVDIIRRGVAEGKDTSVCLLNYRKDGTPFWNQFFVAALRNEHNEVVNYVGVQCEVTEVPMEEELKERVKSLNFDEPS